MTPAEYLAAGFTAAQADVLLRRDEAFDREQRALFGHMAATLDAILVEMRHGFEGVTGRLDSLDQRLGLIEAHLRDSPGRN